MKYKLISIALFMCIPLTSFANITVYEHCNFKGFKSTLPVGNYDLNDLKDRGIINDDISSLKVKKGYEVIVYEHHHFSGKSLKFRNNDKCLVNNNFNDRISSIRVRKIPKPKVATVYQHCNYKGYRAGLSVGNYDLNQLKRLGIRNDDLSSLKIKAGYELIAYQHHHFTGRRWKLRSNDSCFVNKGFNDIISSIQVRRR